MIRMLNPNGSLTPEAIALAYEKAKKSLTQVLQEARMDYGDEIIIRYDLKIIVKTEFSFDTEITMRN